MRTVTLALASAVALAACQPAPKPGGEASPRHSRAGMAQATIRGRATYRERVKMPPGADLVVQLVDRRLADTPPTVVADLRLDDVAGPPYPFVLPYDPARLRADGSHGLHASLRGPDGELWFVTATPVAVTPGDDRVVELPMVRVPGAGETAPPADTSPWAEAKARGVAFRGVGNEPGWFVEVEHGPAPALRATLDYGERMVAVARMQPLAGTPGFSGRTADGATVVLRIRHETCNDGMSDERYPTAVEFTVGGRDYRGCGRFLGE